MNIDKIKDLMALYIPSERKKNFEMDIRNENLGRIKVTATFFLVAEVIIFCIYIFAKKTELTEFPRYIYIGMYLLMIFGMSIYLILFPKIKNDIANTYKYYLYALTFTAFLQAWCAMISLLDQLHTGQIIVYMVATLCIAIFPLFQTRMLLPIYVSVHIVFLVLLPFFQASQGKIFANSINSTTDIIVALIISRYLFKSKYEDYINKVTIEENNKVLYDLNQKLIEANEQLEYLSTTDSLTGLLNRRKFDDIIHSKWEESKKNGLPISLIMMDVDSFKQYNDYFGHQLGDDCIISISRSIKALLRINLDYAARYGGDEFIIILTDKRMDQAYLFAENLRKYIEELHIPLNDEGKDFVTISLGVSSTIPKIESSIQKLILDADQALYQAKSQSRNTVVVSSL